MFDCTQKLILFGQSINEEIYCPSLTYQVAQNVKLHPDWKGRSWCLLLFWSEIVDTVVRLARSLITPVGIVLRYGKETEGIAVYFWYTCGVAGAVIITPFVFAIQLIIQVGHILRVCLASGCGLLVPDSKIFDNLSCLAGDSYDYFKLIDNFLDKNTNLPKNFPVPKGFKGEPYFKDVVNAMINSEIRASNSDAFLAKFTLNAEQEIALLTEKWKKYLQPYFKEDAETPAYLRKIFITLIAKKIVNSSSFSSKPLPSLHKFASLFIKSLNTGAIIDQIKQSNFKEAFRLIEELAKSVAPHFKIFVPGFSFKKPYTNEIEDLIFAITDNIYAKTPNREAFSQSPEFTERFIIDNQKSSGKTEEKNSLTTAMDSLERTFEKLQATLEAKLSTAFETYQKTKDNAPPLPQKTITIEDIKNLRKTLEDLGVAGLSEEFEKALAPILITRGPFKNEMKTRKIKPEKGFILYGPPGTGKTTIARHLATLMKVPDNNVQMIEATSLLSKYHGDTEEKVRELFQPVQDDFEKFGANAPLHIIVIDEIDSILSNRSELKEQFNKTVVNQFLGLLDGTSQFDNCLVIGMTNNIDAIDPAIRRSGRLGKLIKIDLPDVEQRQKIFEVHCKALKENNCLADDVDFAALAKQTEECSGADIEAIVRIANEIVFVSSIMKKDGLEIDKISMTDWIKAIDEIKNQTVSLK